jgi:hypothetical protein
VSFDPLPREFRESPFLLTRAGAEPVVYGTIGITETKGWMCYTTVMSELPHKYLRQSDDKYQLSDKSKIIAGALLTVVVLILQSYFSKSPVELDIYQQWSLIAMAIAIPGLAFWYFLSHHGEAYNLGKKHTNPLAIILVLSTLSAFVVIGLTI